MKKLLNELEAAQNEIATDFDSSDYDCGMTDGFHAALEIVRAHNPWHEVAELPPEWEQYRKQSINVLVLSEEGKVEISYYHFGFKSWGATFAPIGWTYLPEVIYDLENGIITAEEANR